MKLNLLPTYVSKEGQARTAWVISGLLAAGSVAAAVFMIVYSQGQLKDAKAKADSFRQPAADALATAKKADEIIAKATGVDRNLKLAQAMTDHNAVYPNLYQEVMRYIPPFFRVISMSAAPGGAESCTVTLVGQIKSYQQYADVVLALLRMPDAVNVTRAGYTLTDMYVPGLNEQDQLGQPIKPGESSLPSDPIERMNEILARASAAPTGFQNVGGFGTDEPQKGAMPGWSTITMNLVLTRNIQTPNPSATLVAGPGGGGGGGNTQPAGFGQTTPPAPSNPGGAGPARDIQE